MSKSTGTGDGLVSVELISLARGFNEMIIEIIENHKLSQWLGNRQSISFH
jgi:hypothetical protein